jgi:hypothetical protein
MIGTLPGPAYRSALRARPFERLAGAVLRYGLVLFLVADPGGRAARSSAAWARWSRS